MRKPLLDEGERLWLKGGLALAILLTAVFTILALAMARRALHRVRRRRIDE